ncbi:Phytochrome B [Acorus gramineus]|uniref:Phytochrome B n=1 Tax=Acorus gramineus TaxID=55184 RepID=A0AAV9BM00_ACOGR|nr:Phytochrome B [Acorus gramineus]
MITSSLSNPRTRQESNQLKRVRMIVDCLSPPVRVVQDESLAQPLCLVGSTLRAPHDCHARYMANMGSIRSLAMAN